MEGSGPAVCNDFDDMGGRGEMRKAPIELQDLRRRIYVKAKAEPEWRFWGLFVHVCKLGNATRSICAGQEERWEPWD